MILSLPYLVLPLWIGYRLLTRERNTNDLHQEVGFLIYYECSELGHYWNSS